MASIDALTHEIVVAACKLEDESRGRAAEVAARKPGFAARFAAVRAAVAALDAALDAEREPERNLESLADETLWHLAVDNLSARSVRRLATLSRRLRRVYSDAALWRALLRRDFPSANERAPALRAAVASVGRAAPVGALPTDHPKLAYEYMERCEGALVYFEAEFARPLKLRAAEPNTVEFVAKWTPVAFFADPNDEHARDLVVCTTFTHHMRSNVAMPDPSDGEHGGLVAFSLPTERPIASVAVSRNGTLAAALSDFEMMFGALNTATMANDKYDNTDSLLRDSQIVNAPTVPEWIDNHNDLPDAVVAMGFLGETTCVCLWMHYDHPTAARAYVRAPTGAWRGGAFVRIETDGGGIGRLSTVLSPTSVIIGDLEKPRVLHVDEASGDIAVSDITPLGMPGPGDRMHFDSAIVAPNTLASFYAGTGDPTGNIILSHFDEATATPGEIIQRMAVRQGDAGHWNIVPLQPGRFVVWQDSMRIEIQRDVAGSTWRVTADFDAEGAAPRLLSWDRRYMAPLPYSSQDAPGDSLYDVARASFGRRALVSCELCDGAATLREKSGGRLAFCSHECQAAHHGAP